MRIANHWAKPEPLGLTLRDGGANIAVHSGAANRIDLCLFDSRGEETWRGPLALRHGPVHFAFVEGISAGQLYGLRAEGPRAHGNHFDSSKLLLDPYARVISGPFTYHADLSRYGAETARLVPKAVAQPLLPAVTPRRPSKPQLIYELNVRGLTMRHPDVPETLRGTIAALATPAILNHLRAIGVDTVELMPIAAWIDERHLVNLGLRNAWGYNPVSFFALEPRLAPGGWLELRDTVAALHDNGLNVIVDVVLNHTGEGDETGPCLSLRGLDNAGYYRMLDGAYANDAGTGNSLALDRPHTVALALASLRHWVQAYGIDGFRFDLATIMGRTESGFSSNAPLLTAIANDPLLSTRILIAEPWDVTPGGYQLGNFPKQWLEWNDRYRDDARRFWRGDAWSANALATRIAGSHDLFAAKGTPSRSINFVAAHDGFTLADLLTYTEKQNHANGENNRDGKSDEITCPGSNVAAILAALIFSRGTAMITAGDEFGRTQHGNNNAYAQDNETTWLDWSKADSGLKRKLAEAVTARQLMQQFFADEFLDPSTATWHGADGKAVDWTSSSIRTLTLVLLQGDQRLALHVSADTIWRPLAVPPRQGRRWKEIYTSRLNDEHHGVLLCCEEPAS